LLAQQCDEPSRICAKLWKPTQAIATTLVRPVGTVQMPPVGIGSNERKHIGELVFEGRFG